MDPECRFEYFSFTPEMKGWINKTPAEDIDRELNRLGSERWELVSVVPVISNKGTSFGGTTHSFVYYFKRVIC